MQVNKMFDFYADNFQSEDFPQLLLDKLTQEMGSPLISPFDLLLKITIEAGKQVLIESLHTPISVLLEGMREVNKKTKNERIITRKFVDKIADEFGYDKKDLWMLMAAAASMLSGEMMAQILPPDIRKAFRV